MKKIHVTLVSKEALPVFYMINEFSPDFVYLVGTKETTVVMKRIERILQQRHIPSRRCMTSADDMVACADICEQQIHAFNGDDCEYCYNLTGGTKLMAFGAMKCAERHGARIVYTDTTSYVDIATMERKPITRMIDIDTVITLQGQKVKEKSVYRYDAQRTECAEAVRDFMATNIKAYNALMTHYSRYRQLPNPYENGKVRYYRAGGQIVVEYDDVEVFSSAYPGAFKMLFEGRWWETLVANAVARWAGADREVWVNVRFEPNEEAAKKNDKNEIDVLVNIGNTLLFVECKAGTFTQDNIYKLNSVCQTYGSYKSKGCIVEYHENCIKSGFGEKADDDRIKLIVPKRDFSDLSQQLDEIVQSLRA